MEDIVKSSYLMLASIIASFLPMLYFFSVTSQFGPGHVQGYLTGKVTVSTWQHWSVRSLVLLGASCVATVVLLQLAGYDFTYIETLMFYDLGAGSAASMIVLLNVVLKSPRCHPSWALQTEILAFTLISLGAAAWVGVASGLAREVLVDSSVGAIFGLAMFYPLYLMQRSGLRGTDER
jgi:hypothetical protein